MASLAGCINALEEKIGQLTTEVIELKSDKHTEDVVEDTSTIVDE